MHMNHITPDRGDDLEGSTRMAEYEPESIGSRGVRVPPRLRTYPMRCFRPVTQLEIPYGLFLQVIRLRDALVLAQMFEPGVCSEGLNEAALFGGILEYTPVVCSISAARIRIFRERAQKLVTTLRIDAVFDRHQHRSSIGLDRSSRDRIRPMHRRRKVDVDARLQLPAPREW